MNGFVRNRLGVRSGLTREFNISSKKRLKDPLQLLINGVLTSKSIRTWILEKPIAVYDCVYVNKTLKLTHDAISLLKEELEKKHPKYFEAIKIKRARHNFKRRVLTTVR
jgi:hypothetical protein